MKCTKVVVHDSAVELAYPGDAQAIESEKANPGGWLFRFQINDLIKFWWSGRRESNRYIRLCSHLRCVWVGKTPVIKKNH